MTTHGRPDGPRSARYILKDYVNGRLLYCHPPPGVDPVIFNQFSPLLPGHQTELGSIADKVADSAGEDLSKTDSTIKVNLWA